MSLGLETRYIQSAHIQTHNEYEEQPLCPDTLSFCFISQNCIFDVVHPPNADLTGMFRCLRFWYETTYNHTLNAQLYDMILVDAWNGIDISRYDL